MGWMLGERLTRDGVNWANLRFTPPSDLANQIAGPMLATTGVQFFNDDFGPAVTLKLLLDLPQETPVYFRPLSDQRGMAEALWSAVRDLRLADLGSKDLAASQFASPAKFFELRALVAAYEQYLVRGELADMATILRKAVSCAAGGPVHAGDLILEFPGACTNVLERRFVDALPATKVPAQKFDVPRLTEPRRFATLSPAVQRLDSATEGLNDAKRLRWLLAPTSAPPTAVDGTLQMFRAAGVEAEVEEVLHRVVSRKLSLDTVEIACAHADVYPGLIWEKAQRHGWPVTMQMGVPGALTRPVRAILALCDWIEANFSAESLIAVLQSGDLDPVLGADLSAVAAGRIVRRSGATMGRQTYASSLSAIAAADRSRAEDSELEPESRTFYSTRATHAEHVADWVTSLLQSIPITSPADTALVGEVVSACAAFVSQVAVRSQEDAAAAKAIIAALDALQPLSDLRRPASFALELVRNRIRNVRVCAELPRPGALYVTSLSGAGCAGRAATFVVGLAERSVFPRGLEDPVLLDAERTSLATEALATSQDRVAEAVAAALQRLTNLEGTVDLSFSCRDLRQGREMFPSWILLNALALLKPGVEFSYRELNQYLGEPASVVPKDAGAALNDSEWWLARLRGAGQVMMPSVLEAFPKLERGTTAAAARSGSDFTAYDGMVRQAGPILDIRTPGRVVSASTLEAFAACPFRHFLRYGLNIAALEGREGDPDAWLQPSERGLLLHAIYARFLRNLRAKGRRPVAADAEDLHQQAAVSIEELRAQIPPPSEGVFARETAQLRRDLDFFLRGELSSPERTPVALEVSFGFLDEGNEEPLATINPVPIDLGDGQKIWLRGRIDRIDRLADGHYEVIDYKTGGLYHDGYRGTFAGGKLLQHALYSRAARELLLPLDPEPRLGTSTYYFASEKGAAQRVSFPAELDVTPVLRDLAEAIAGGSFPSAVGDKECKWCDYGRDSGRWCGSGAARTEAKLESGGTVVAAFKRLREHD